MLVRVSQNIPRLSLAGGLCLACYNRSAPNSHSFQYVNGPAGLLRVISGSKLRQMQNLIMEYDTITLSE